MAPVVKALEATDTLRSVVCVTGQHREMLHPILRAFDITPDVDLALMTAGQGLNDIVTRAIEGINRAIETYAPDLVIVQGDTSTAMAGALAAFNARVAVAHVEAGLRTFDLSRPWPEEMNRKVIDSFADLMFAPTRKAAQHLSAERQPGRHVLVTGNTVIDALLEVAGRLTPGSPLADQCAAAFPFLDPARRLILVTGHRRESFGEGFRQICHGLRQISALEAVQIVYPVHLNPNVQGPVSDLLGGLETVHLISPLDYVSFIYLMSRADIVLTDSGGVQEEAPSLGKPVLVMRDVTERDEAVAVGTVRLVGANAERMAAETQALLSDPVLYARMSEAHNPYGDGMAAGRIVRTIEQYLAGGPITQAEWQA